MKTFRLAVLAAACAASLPAFSQTAGAPGRAAGAPASPAVSPPAAPAATGGNTESAPGSVSNPSFGTSIPSFGNTNPSFGTPPAGTGGGVGDTSNTALAQAQQRRQLALQQCQAMSGSAQADCVRAADDAFVRETQSPVLAQGAAGAAPSGPAIGTAPAPTTGMIAGSTRTTPDVTPTPRDSVVR